MTPGHERESDPIAPPKIASDVVDPDFDQSDEAEAEFTRWRWPERSDE
ncbi:hypothetical protein HZZ16_17445 [Bradyrhizobium sp. CNPSo 4016]|nr:hypothetical protein [Bradyrhizobium glycinis]